MPRAIHASGFDPVGLVYLAVVLAVIFAPVVFGRRRSSPESDSGPEDGHGRGPRRRPKNPVGPPGGIGPRGGIPLPDAVQSLTRLRDYGRLADRSPRPWRRYVHAPQRRRQRTSASI